MGQRCGELEVATEALEARLMRKPFGDEADVLCLGSLRRRAEVDALPPTALFTAHLDVHILL